MIENTLNSLYNWKTKNIINNFNYVSKTLIIFIDL